MYLIAAKNLSIVNSSVANSTTSASMMIAAAHSAQKVMMVVEGSSSSSSSRRTSIIRLNLPQTRVSYCLFLMILSHTTPSMHFCLFSKETSEEKIQGYEFRQTQCNFNGKKTSP